MIFVRVTLAVIFAPATIFSTGLISDFTSWWYSGLDSSEGCVPRFRHSAMIRSSMFTA